MISRYRQNTAGGAFGAFYSRNGTGGSGDIYAMGFGPGSGAIHPKGSGKATGSRQTGGETGWGAGLAPC